MTISSDEKVFSCNAIHRKQSGKIELNISEFRFESKLESKDAQANMNGEVVALPWCNIIKHQVSPASHPKSLLKIIHSKENGKGLTFQVQNRTVLEKVRSEISVKLAESRRCAKKRPREEVSGDDNSVTFTGFNSDALVISRASLLADNDDL